MTDVESRSENSTSARRSRWPLAFSITLIVVLAGLVAAGQQFFLKFLWDESAHTRTFPGVLYMLLGVVGLYLPIRLLRERQHFAEQSPSRQWFAVIGVPLIYIATFAAFVEASRRSTTLILPRPFAPTAVVTYDSSRPDKRTDVEFRNALREHHPSGGFGHSPDTAGGIERFNASFYQGFLLHDRKEMGTLKGQTRLVEDGSIEIAIDVDAKERLQFNVRGLDDVVIKRDGEVISESDAKSGKYEIVIVGQPIKDT